ncbi:aminotransferase class I/II-fold pyridoxal phosphate-dependent enzyme, partial [Aquabacterium sp. A08]|uniref:aminotransferase class I/II-fold pyridoxal phosphate-dependent enzyme n=1 Tax=Aquabacterium sp. A08 TaxID=2718532 RepID=UPI00141EB9AD
DLVAKVLIDPGSRVLVETPTYLGALQAFGPMEPEVVGVPGDDEGPALAGLRQALGLRDETADTSETPERRRLLQLDLTPARGFPRFMYLLPNFQNPTGRTMSEARRAALSAETQRLGLPIVEDNPYGDLWFDAPPPAPLTARHPAGCVYLGSFSKVLAPGLRLGFLVAPPALYP